MITVYEKPIKEIVIHKHLKLSIEDFKNYMDGHTMPYWCNGILFMEYHFPQEEVIVKSRLEGTVNLLEVVWCKCEEYPKIVRKEGQATEYPVLNVTNDKMFCALTDWLKTR